jgi:hypothetical protein
LGHLRRQISRLENQVATLQQKVKTLSADVYGCEFWDTLAPKTFSDGSVGYPLYLDSGCAWAVFQVQGPGLSGGPGSWTPFAVAGFAPLDVPPVVHPDAAWGDLPFRLRERLRPPGEHLHQFDGLLQVTVGPVAGSDSPPDERQPLQGLGGEEEGVTPRGGQRPRLRLSEPMALLPEPLEFGRVVPVPLPLLSFADGLVIGFRVISYRVLCVALLA